MTRLSAQADRGTASETRLVSAQADNRVVEDLEFIPGMALRNISYHVCRKPPGFSHVGYNVFSMTKSRFFRYCMGKKVLCSRQIQPW